MRFSEQWLRDWIDPPVVTAELAERLTLLGLEVDSVEPAAPPFTDIVIGRIADVGPHPQADRLKVCHVDDGSGEIHEVVCGAPNAAVGLHAPYARVGATLPDGTAIAPTDIRGVTSRGMLCSARELGMAENSDGLLALPEDSPVGENFRIWAQLDDNIIELDLTPNRGDCLSIRGLAREVAVGFGRVAAGPECAPIEPVHSHRFPVWLEAPAGCPRYAGRVIHGIDPSATTPSWLVERLRRAGIRSVAPVVDVTNYVMLELGQPMHAFDLGQLSEGIRVRYAERGERLDLLDGRTVDLDPETLVIADAGGPVALAGIMGGSATAVGGATHDVFLESACFLPHAMAGRPRRYATHSDSAHRFERGVDPEVTVMAMERATALLLDVCGGQPGPVHDVVEPEYIPRHGAIRLRRARLERILGYHPGDERVAAILAGLGLSVTADDAGWSATPPSWRYDLGIEADLVEEIARVHGYNEAPRTHPAHATRIDPVPERSRDLDALRDLLVERDYHEAVTYSFVDSGLQRRLDPDTQALALTNPISSDMDVMRTGLWPGLLGALQHNINRQLGRVRLFEAGLRFRPDDNGALAQEEAIALLAAGPVQEEHWDLRQRPVDFFDVKADVEALFAGADASRFRFEPAGHPALHPGQSARILVDGESVGWMGVLHPAHQETLDLPGAPVLFEMAVRPLLERPLPAYRAVSRYPSIRRDLAVIVDENLPAQAILGMVGQAAPEELQSAFVFDVYRGKGIDSGRKSFALGLILRGFGRTLTDSEVDEAVARILQYLEANAGATLRE